MSMNKLGNHLDNYEHQFEANNSNLSCNISSFTEWLNSLSGIFGLLLRGLSFAS